MPTQPHCGCTLAAAPAHGFSCLTENYMVCAGNGAPTGNGFAVRRLPHPSLRRARPWVDRGREVFRAIDVFGLRSYSASIAYHALLTAISFLATVVLLAWVFGI